MTDSRLSAQVTEPSTIVAPHRHIAKLPVSDKDRLLTLVAEDQAARARMELLRGFGTDPDKQRDSRRTVAEPLDTAGARRLQRGR